MHRYFAPLGLALLLAACGQSGTTSLGGTGTKEVLRIVSSNLPAAYAGETYNANVQIAGGLNPYTLRVASGTLPPGVTLRGNSLTGTPTTPGRYEFVLEATDASLSTRAQSFAVNVGTLPPLDIAPTFPAGEFRSDTRVPVKINYPRDTRAARFQWQLPEGVQVTKVDTGQGGQLLMWKQTGNTLTFDVGFTKAPASGANVALVGLKFAGPTKLDAAKRAFTAVDAQGKLVAQKTFAEAASAKCTPVVNATANAGAANSTAKPASEGSATGGTSATGAAPATAAPAGTPASTATTAPATNQAPAGAAQEGAAAPSGSAPATGSQAAQAPATGQNPAQAGTAAKPPAAPATSAASAPVTPADTSGVVRPACDPPARTSQPSDQSSGNAETETPPADTAPAGVPAPTTPEGDAAPDAPQETAPESPEPEGERATPPSNEETGTEGAPSEPGESSDNEEVGTPSVPTIGEPGSGGAP